MGSLEIELDTREPEFQQDAIFYVNGKRVVLPDGLAHLTLLEYLRRSGLTGTKLGCGEGGCGACTVMVSHYDCADHVIVHRAVNACLAPLYSVEGMHVVTVEGIGSSRKGLHPVQEALANSHGSQCGFCTPGFVMSMYALLRSSRTRPTQEEIEECLAGNLCRCTGYRPILDAFRTFAKVDSSQYHAEFSRSCGNTLGRKTVSSKNGSICPSTGLPCDCAAQKTHNDMIEESANFKEDSMSELIYPPELANRKLKALFLKGYNGLKWYRPTQLQDLLDLIKQYPDAKLVIGNTEIGIETRFKRISYPVLIAMTHVPELNMLKVTTEGLEIGASINFTKLIKTLKDIIQDQETYKTSACSAILEQLKWFAGTQIRNIASIGGNICTASPISDLNPLWIAARAHFKTVNVYGVSRVIPAEEFFVSYRKTALDKGEILLSVFLPWTRKNEIVKEFKQAHRREDDIALVNAGIRVWLQEGSAGAWSVAEASLVFGGVAAVPLSASKSETFLKGKFWNQETLEAAVSYLKEEIVIAEDAPGGMVEFRRSLILSFFFKFYLASIYALQDEAKLIQEVPITFKSAAYPTKRGHSHGEQNFKAVTEGTAVGLPLAHSSAALQATGEAEYVDDVKFPSDGLYAALVLSTRPHARIISISSLAAEIVAGFVGFFTAKDVPGANDIGLFVHDDEELFAAHTVTSVGQIIGIVVADSPEAANIAKQKIVIEYEDLPAILSIEDALHANSFFPGTERMLERGDIEQCFGGDVCDHIVEGKVQVGGQEHFYMEPNGSIVWTADGGNEVIMLSSTQAPQKHQKTVAHVLGIPLHKVICKTKRIGGGFGGKETRSAIFAAAASVPAYLLRRHVKLILDRDTDMLASGQRHAFIGNYKIGFSSEGKIQALDLELYNNGGNTFDLSSSVLERAIFHCDNVYHIPNIRVRGKVCCTNITSNTAFRGFGAPQGMIVAENWIEHIASFLGTSPDKIREENFQKEGSVLHYGQTLEHCRLQQVWEELKSSCNFNQRMHEVNDFNALNRWRKRGLSIIPTKFGISFTAKFMNQAGALVHVYTDGTVLVTHGGVEMGQGLHTKIAQITATAFHIPVTSVFISETSTDKVPNASPTAASASSDIYGAAVLDACLQIKERMEPVAKRGMHSSFAELASTCYMERIDLSAHGFYKTPDLHFDWETGNGRPYNYFTYGAACAEVEVDTLTGDSYLRRADIVMDLGNSLNPAIDIGQVEGAFIQGLGLVCLEEVKWGDDAHPWVKHGHLFTQGPGTYKLPTVNDIPVDFRVSLLKDAPNNKAIHSSKAVGEPPLFLAASTVFAIRDAISAARKDSGHQRWFVLDTPATPERIRMACVDQFTQLFASSDFRPKLSV